MVISTYPESYINFLVHFHGDRDYFECHEILEDYWKEHTSGEKNSVWVGLIQLAVALYHHRRANFKGASTMIKQSKQKILSFTNEAQALSLDTDELLKMISEIEGAILSESPYQSVMLPLSDKKLIKICSEECSKRGFNWGDASNTQNKALVDRHRLRDRTDVISLRKNALLMKSKLNK
ncbi:DUF309 domain-containing protein [Jeotgalibacillus salarius]|uniref:DUF309 domain-containing protein n=1 Tax=Jeotgalibacillus salarius TaxID=546023 RepID=A0A4Y8LJL8_9BACL|nr:DUF309 domain-containing protein [Jeotgalibacillus salarius]TFE03128.1 DUF309 domain-containing protein [Jeotgalibacillus salarius]